MNNEQNVAFAFESYEQLCQTIMSLSLKDENLTDKYIRVSLTNCMCGGTGSLLKITKNLKVIVDERRSVENVEK